MENKTNKNQLIIIAIVILVLAGSFYYTFNKRKTEKETPENVAQNTLNLTTEMGGAEGLSSLIDLNNDGQLDLIIQPNGGNYCGTGGCTTFVFKNTGKNFELVNEISLTRDLYVLSSNTNGWLDLATLQSGGGMPEAKYKKLQFDGAKYPSSAEDGIETTLGGQDRKIF